MSPLQPNMRAIYMKLRKFWEFWKKIKIQTWNLSNVWHQQDSQLFKILPEKCVNRDIFGKNWELRMFYSSILNKLPVFVQLFTPIQTQSSNVVKTLARIWQISQNWQLFVLIREHFTRAKNILNKCHLCHLWQMPSLATYDVRRDILSQITILIVILRMQPLLW